MEEKEKSQEVTDKEPKEKWQGDSSAECGIGSTDGSQSLSPLSSNKNNENKESDSKWQGSFSSAAEREALKEGEDNRIIRDIERGEVIKLNKSKRRNIIVFAVVSVSFLAFLGYITAGILAPFMPAAPVVAGILTYFIHKHHLNRLISPVLFILPAALTLPLFYIGLGIAGVGAIVGITCEDKYKQF